MNIIPFDTDLDSNPIHKTHTNAHIPKNGQQGWHKYCYNQPPHLIKFSRSLFFYLHPFHTPFALSIIQKTHKHKPKLKKKKTKVTTTKAHQKPKNSSSLIIFNLWHLFLLATHVSLIILISQTKISYPYSSVHKAEQYVQNAKPIYKIIHSNPPIFSFRILYLFLYETQ